MFDFERINIRKTVNELSTESRGKVEKSQGNVREFCVKNLADTLLLPPHQISDCR